MKYFEVGYKVAEGVYSINTMWANTGTEELEAVTETAQRHASRHGYEVVYIKPITTGEAEEANRRGRPMCSIDDEAEQAHDPSYREAAEALGHMPTTRSMRVFKTLEAHVERMHEKYPKVPIEALWEDLKKDLEAIIAEG